MEEYKGDSLDAASLKKAGGIPLSDVGSTSVPEAADHFEPTVHPVKHHDPYEPPAQGFRDTPSSSTTLLRPDRKRLVTPESERQLKLFICGMGGTLLACACALPLMIFIIVALSFHGEVIPRKNFGDIPEIDISYHSDEPTLLGDKTETSGAYFGKWDSGVDNEGSFLEGCLRSPNDGSVEAYFSRGNVKNHSKLPYCEDVKKSDAICDVDGNWVYISVFSSTPGEEFYLELEAKRDKDAPECYPPAGAVFGVWFAMLIMVCCGTLGASLCVIGFVLIFFFNASTLRRTYVAYSQQLDASYNG